MSVSIILTTTQKPVFDKIMKDNKVKVSQNGNLIDLDKNTYDKVMSVLQDHWFKKTMAEDGADEAALLHMIGRLSMLGNLFPNALETEEVAKQINEETKIGDEKDGE